MSRSAEMSIVSIPPNRWQGERGCVVGPFSNPKVAKAFITYVLILNHVQVSSDTIFERMSAFYIRVQPSVQPALRQNFLQLGAK